MKENIDVEEIEVASYSTCHRLVGGTWIQRPGQECGTLVLEE